MDEVGIVSDKSNAEQIMLHCTIVNDYLLTVKKALIADGEDIEGFLDHYSDLIQVALDLNWDIHNAADAISREDFRRSRLID